MYIAFYRTVDITVVTKYATRFCARANHVSKSKSFPSDRPQRARCRDATISALGHLGRHSRRQEYVCSTVRGEVSIRLEVMFLLSSRATLKPLQAPLEREYRHCYLKPSGFFHECPRSRKMDTSTTRLLSGTKFWRALAESRLPKHELRVRPDDSCHKIHASPLF